MDGNRLPGQKSKSAAARLKRLHPLIQLVLLIVLVVGCFYAFYFLLLMPNLLGLG